MLAVRKQRDALWVVFTVRHKRLIERIRVSRAEQYIPCASVPSIVIAE